MDVLWGTVLVVLGLLCWGGQVVSQFAVGTAVRLGLTEAETEVEPAVWADFRGEALWDALTLWTIPVAGVLLIAGTEAWAYFGLVGAGMYLYFAGRGIASRRALQRGDFRIGATQSVKVGYTFLVIWGVMALVTIGAAVAEIRV